MKNNDCLFSDIQNLCNSVSDWLIQKSIIQLKPTRQYPVPVVTSCVITAEPVKFRMSDASFAYNQSNVVLQNNVSALQGNKSRYR